MVTCANELLRELAQSPLHRFPSGAGVCVCQKHTALPAPTRLTAGGNLPGSGRSYSVSQPFSQTYFSGNLEEQFGEKLVRCQFKVDVLLYLLKYF